MHRKMYCQEVCKFFTRLSRSGCAVRHIPIFIYMHCVCATDHFNIHSFIFHVVTKLELQFKITSYNFYNRPLLLCGGVMAACTYVNKFVCTVWWIASRYFIYSKLETVSWYNVRVELARSSIPTLYGVYYAQGYRKGLPAVE